MTRLTIACVLIAVSAAFAVEGVRVAAQRKESPARPCPPACVQVAAQRKESPRKPPKVAVVKARVSHSLAAIAD